MFDGSSEQKSRCIFRRTRTLFCVLRVYVWSWLGTMYGEVCLIQQVQMTLVKFPAEVNSMLSIRYFWFYFFILFKSWSHHVVIHRDFDSNIIAIYNCYRSWVAAWTVAKTVHTFLLQGSFRQQQRNPPHRELYLKLQTLKILEYQKLNERTLSWVFIVSSAFSIWNIVLFIFFIMALRASVCLSRHEQYWSKKWAVSSKSAAYLSPSFLPGVGHSF